MQSPPSRALARSPDAYDRSQDACRDTDDRNGGRDDALMVVVDGNMVVVGVRGGSSLCLRGSAGSTFR